MDKWMDRCTEGWMGNNNKHFYIISHNVTNEYASSYRAHLYTKKVNIIKAQTNFHVLLTVFPLMISLSQMFISMSVTWQNFYTLLHNSISIKNNAAHSRSFSSWNVMIFVYWFLQMTLITYSPHCISVDAEMNPKMPIVKGCINCAWRSMRSVYCSMRESDSNRWSLRIGT